MIYAFKDESYQETMEEHILNGIEFIDKGFLERGYHVYIAKRLHLLGIEEISPVEVKKAIATAYIYHDIGKALQLYQETLVRGEGARSHEIFSSIILFRNLEGQNFFSHSMLLDACCLSVLLHMTAARQNLKTELTNVLSKFSKYEPVKKLYINEQNVDELNTIIRKAWHRLKLSDPAPLIREKPLALNHQYIISSLLKIISVIDSKFNRWYRSTMFLMLSILHPILLADCYAAAIARKTDKRRPFVDEFIEAFAPEVMN